MNGRALAAGGWQSDALASSLLAALLHAEHGRLDEARALLVDIGPAASRGRSADQLLLGRVVATLADRSGNRAAARRAVTAGLRAAAAGQATLGSLEARSHAAHHGAELIELGARLAVEDGRPRELLHRIESMRTMVWRAPIVRAPDDAAMAALLADLRRTSAAAVDPDVDPDARRVADRNRVRVEREIRDLSRRARGSRRQATTTEAAVAEAIGALGDRDLLAYADLGGHLHVVLVRRGRTTLHDLGPTAELGEYLEPVRVRVCTGSTGYRDRRRRAVPPGSCSRRARPRSPPSCCRAPSPAAIGRSSWCRRACSTVCRGARFRRCAAGPCP